MSLRQHFRLLDDGISRLLSGLPQMPAGDHGTIRHYIDNDEYGLALETLTWAATEHGIPLNDDQVSEIDRLSKLMGLDTGASEKG
jgi:hypothetical protein